MSFMLVLNNNNNVGNNNNTYQYNFTKGNFSIPESTEIMITNIQIPYSWFNISELIGNNRIVFLFPTGASQYVFNNIIIPDGFYTTTTLNYYFQSWMISKGYYLVNASSGENYYFFNISYNTSSYDNQVLIFTVPTIATLSSTGLTFPSGYTTTSIFNGYGFPTTLRTPILQIPQLKATPTIGNFLGFGSTTGTTDLPPIFAGTPANITYTVSAGIINFITIVDGGSGYVNPSISFTSGTGAIVNLNIENGVIIGTTIINGGTGYTAGTATITPNAGSFSALSTITPQGSTVNSLVIRCSLVRNNVANPPDILDSFSIPTGSDFGTNINYAPSVEKFVKATEGTFNNFVITICDQNLNPIYANDNNVLITLLMKFPTKLLK